MIFGDGVAAEWSVFALSLLLGLFCWLYRNERKRYDNLYEEDKRIQIRLIKLEAEKMDTKEARQLYKEHLDQIYKKIEKISQDMNAIKVDIAGMKK